MSVKIQAMRGQPSHSMLIRWRRYYCSELLLKHAHQNWVLENTRFLETTDISTMAKIGQHRVGIRVVTNLLCEHEISQQRFLGN